MKAFDSLLDLHYDLEEPEQLLLDEGLRECVFQYRFQSHEGGNVYNMCPTTRE